MFVYSWQGGKLPMPRSEISIVPMVIRLFGPMDVQVDGHPLPRLATRKRMWLLALLVLRQDRDVDRVWLAGTLWPDSSEQQALANLRQSLAELRRALGQQAERLQSTSRFVRLDLTGAFCDVQVFDMALAILRSGYRREETPGNSHDSNVTSSHYATLLKAVELYRGPLLEGCAEEWVIVERETRELAFMRALQTLAHQAMDRADPGEAVQLLRRAVSVAPLEESVHRLLMSALAAHGDFAAATQVFRDLRALLRRDLNTSPSEETIALYQRLQDHARSAAMLHSAIPSRPGYLPKPRTELIGRESELGEIRTILLGDGAVNQAQFAEGRNIPTLGNRQFEKPSWTTTRLLTLTGTGGIGKTRLAIQAAEELRAHLSDGVWFVDFSGLFDPVLVPRTTASILGIREEQGRPILETLTDYLTEKHILLVLDNCEHLVRACAGLVDNLLARCTRLSVLATSRQPLGVSGEYTLRVPSLPLPPVIDPRSDASAASVFEDLLGFASVRLFLDRVRYIEPNFTLNSENAASVTEICHRLDGIPLALELAAARAKVLSVSQIATRLSDRFRLLTGGSEPSPTRQQTLRAAIDWSYDLLSESERMLLIRLSVMAKGWTLEAAEAICGTPPIGAAAIASPSPLEVLNLLEKLVDKSLIVADTQRAEARYRMLETIRQYAWERLEESGYLPAQRERHLDYFLSLAEEAKPNLQGTDQARWLDRLEVEHDNLRAALQFSIEVQTSAAIMEMGLRLACALWRFWFVRGHLNEGRGCLNALLAQTAGSSSGRSEALHCAGALAWEQGDFDASRQYYSQSLAIKRELGDRRGIAGALSNLGVLALAQGDPDTAMSFQQESLAIRRDLGDSQGIAAGLNNLGLVADDRGHYSLARDLYNEALTINRQSGNRNWQANNLNNLGNTALNEGNPELAQKYQSESLVIKRELGDLYGMGTSLDSLGRIALQQGNLHAAHIHLFEALSIWRTLGTAQGLAEVFFLLAELAAKGGEQERSATLYGVSEAMRDSVGMPIPLKDKAKYESDVAAVRAATGDNIFASAWEEGRRMRKEQAVDYAMDSEYSKK
jgi:predicted ATPase/DNA-binding SARP family transcriptional activator